LEIITLAGKTTSSIFKTTEYPLGEIRKINVSKNKNLKELIMPNQELEGTLDLSANSQLEKINIANNLLNQLKVHGNFSQKLKGIASNYLQPQKHNKDKIHPVKDVNVILLDMSRKQKKSIGDLYEEKNQEFLQLKTKLESKFANDWQLSHLETLLISQEQIVHLADANPQIIALSEREFQRVEKKLKEQLSEEEIREICQLKVEITKLKIELEE